jgi:hypothetical protein
VAGVRVGIFGLTLETLSKVYMRKVARDSVLRDPMEAAKKVAGELRSKVDLVIALSHLREETNAEIARALKDLEIIVDPYIHHGNPRTWIKEDEWVSYHDDTLVLRADGQGARMGIVDIEWIAPRTKLVDRDRLEGLTAAVAAGTATSAEQSELEGLRGKSPFQFLRVSIEPHYFTDPEIELLLEKHRKKEDPAAVPRLEDELPRSGDYLLLERCSSCHEAQNEFWKTTKHASAMATLAATGEETRFDCVGCHSTGYGQAFLDISAIEPFAEVQCEACHGTNPAHADDPQANRFPPTTKRDCLNCHNKEITEHDFHYYKAKRQVACPKG